MAKNTDTIEETGSKMPHEDVENHGGMPDAKNATPEPEVVEIEVTEELLKLNPEMVKEGIEVGDKFKVDLKDTEEFVPNFKDLEAANVESEEDLQAAATIDEATLGKLARYSKLYPNSKKFHITSDGQVFVDTSLNDAKTHQKGLGEGELKSYAV